MTNGPPEARLQSYELTQKLAFFVIGLEVVFCGYLLLNANKFSEVPWVEFLFLVTALAAISGMVWRFCYNATYHQETHGRQSSYERYQSFQVWSYRAFVVLTLLFLLGTTVGGYQYIRTQKTEPLIIVDDSSSTTLDRPAIAPSHEGKNNK